MPGFDETLLLRIAAQPDPSLKQTFDNTIGDIERLDTLVKGLGKGSNLNAFAASVKTINSSTKDLGRRLTDAGTGLENFAQSAKQAALHGKSLAELNTAITPLAETFAKIGKGSSSLTRSMSQVKKRTDEAKVAIDSFATQASGAAARIQQLPTTLLATREGMRRMVTTARRVSTGFEEVAAAAGGVGNRLSAIRWQEGIAGLKSMAAAQARFLVSGKLVFGVLNQIEDGIGRVSEISSQAARSAALLTQSQAKLGSTQSTVARAIVAATGRYAVSVNEAGDALRELAQAGLSAEESISALPAVLNLAVGTGGDFAQTAKTTAGVFKVFGDELSRTGDLTESFGRATDVLAKGAAISLANVTDLVEGFKFLAPVARQAGFDIESTVAILAQLNDKLVRGGLGARGARSAIVSLISKSDELKKAFNITFEGGGLEGLIPVLEKINVGLNDSTTRTETFTKITSILGKQGITVFQSLADSIDPLRDKYRQIKDEADGFAKSLADPQILSLAGQLKDLGTNISNLIATSLAPLGETLRQLLLLINPVIAEFNNFNAAMHGIPGLVIAAAVALNAYSKAATAAAAATALAKAATAALVPEMIVLDTELIVETTLLEGTAVAAAGAAASTEVVGEAMIAATVAAVPFNIAFGAIAIGGLALTGVLIGLSKLFPDVTHSLADLTDAERAHRNELEQTVALDGAYATSAENLIKAIDDQREASTALALIREGLLASTKRETDALDARVAKDQEIISTESSLLVVQGRISASALASTTDLRRAGIAVADTYGAIRTEGQATIDTLDRQEFQFKTQGLTDLLGQLLQTKQDAEDAGKSLEGLKNKLGTALRGAALSRPILETLGVGAASIALSRFKNQFDSFADDTNQTSKELFDKLAANGAELFQQLPQGDPLFLKQLTEAAPEVVAKLENIVVEQIRMKESAYDAARAEAILKAAVEEQGKASDVASHAVTELAIARIKAAQADDFAGGKGDTGRVARAAADEAQISALILKEQSDRINIFADAAQKNADQISILETRIEQEKGARILASLQGRLEKEKSLLLQNSAAAKTLEVQRDRESYQRQLDLFGRRLQEETQLKAKALQAQTALERQANNSHNELVDLRISKLNDEDRLSRQQLEIRRAIASVSIAPPDSDQFASSIEKSNDALQRARALLQQLPTTAVESNGKIVASEEDLASIRESLLKKIQAGQEQVARAQRDDAGDAALQAKQNFDETDKGLTALAASLQKSEGELKSLTEQLSLNMSVTLKGAVEDAGGAIDKNFGSAGVERLNTYNTELNNTKEAWEAIAKAASQVPPPPLPGGTGEPKRWGGQVPGYGGGDILPYRLEPGEHVIRKEVVSHFGSEFFDSLQRFQLPQRQSSEEGEGRDTFVFAPSFSAEDLRSVHGMSDEQVDRVLDRMGTRWQKWLYNKRGRRL